MCHSWGFLEGSTVEAVLTHGVERKSSRGSNLQKTQSNMCATRCSGFFQRVHVVLSVAGGVCVMVYHGAWEDGAPK